MGVSDEAAAAVVVQSVAELQAPSAGHLLVVACVALGLGDAAEVSVEPADLARLARFAVAVPGLVGIAVGEVLVLALSDPKVSEQGVGVGHCWGQVCWDQSSCRELRFLILLPHWDEPLLCLKTSSRRWSHRGLRRPPHHRTDFHRIRRQSLQTRQWLNVSSAPSVSSKSDWAC